MDEYWSEHDVIDWGRNPTIRVDWYEDIIGTQKQSNLEDAMGDFEPLCVNFQERESLYKYHIFVFAGFDDTTQCELDYYNFTIEIGEAILLPDHDCSVSN